MEKEKSDEPGELIDVFIQLQQTLSSHIEAIIKQIEDGAGRILHVYPPYLMIARIPKESIVGLQKKSCDSFRGHRRN